MALSLAACTEHLETPVAPAGGPFTGYPTFSVPPEITTAIAHTGYDSCSTASNHTLDEGSAGVGRTLDALDRAGVAHTGSARSAAEAARPLLLDANGVPVAQLSYTFGFNGFQPPAGKPWLANQIDPAAIIHAARRAHAAGARVVIVSMHWGTEYQQQVNAEQRRLAHRLLADASIDLIIGHHAHVVQPFQRINGKWVDYGMGNLMARHDESGGTTEEGVLARFHFTRAGTRWTVDDAEYLPTLIDFGPPLRVVDLTGPSAADVPAKRRAEALRRTGSVVRSLGAAGDGLSRGGR
ncbi:MAG: CapA family protein [Sciscionella sp.]